MKKLSFRALQTQAEAEAWGGEVLMVLDGAGWGEVDTQLVLTVEFSVRLVRTGKSLLMVQVSVSEPCRGSRRGSQAEMSPLSRL